MRTTASISLSAALGLLVLSTPAAHAAPTSIKKVSQNGSAVSVKLANPNSYRVSGSVSLITGQQLLASKKAGIRAHKSAGVTLKLPSGAPTGGTVQVVTRLGRKGGKPVVRRKSVKLGKPGKGGPSSGKVSTPSKPTAAPSNRWTGVNAYGDQIPMVVENGRISLAGPQDIGVNCNQTGEYVYNSGSFEHFDLYKDWAVGNQDEVRQLDTTRLNVLADSSVHRVSYRLSSSRSGDTITGALYQSYALTKYNPFSGGMSYVNCSGTVEFTAHPAP